MQGNTQPQANMTAMPNAQGANMGTANTGNMNGAQPVMTQTAVKTTAAQQAAAASTPTALPASMVDFASMLFEFTSLRVDE